MSEENKAMVRTLYAEIDKGNLGAVDEAWSRDHVFHTPGSPAMDAVGHRQLLAMYQGAFAEWRQEITNMVAEGDQVVTMFTFHGRHTGDLEGIAATDRTVAVDAVAIARLADGRIVEEWTIFDGLGLLQQLGASPVPA
jgi:predicted ester cyclase